ncbi:MULTISPECIES: L-histidine N(alpha)-methyltransferase [Methylosinus]|uniref:L-histidine N(Alpha)-methyltransferase n=1 Tax=Methylosinus trichosporium (strain ATCC 35070 / NCIMB 11131 / UNIQEM 75 / OB3b) TaxID=595536 RepID=A0A2D2D586_METT3|nr:MULTISPECIES: L-histidine N(alpha)-methyltransferase [Methylosinus]ATQ70136.1 L-histidine N(alpha)-methyltransferase [Methylosinus trichosporium OB3b]OBS52000.1 dimethylhistidine N-methyltransferase [Methylosinus sp. 3S-1]
MENAFASTWPEGFAADVLDGLSRPSKRLSCRYFYDAEGSSLFDEITRLPDYYPTRAETAILEAHAAEILDGAGEETTLVEFGSGSCRKTEILLERGDGLAAYAPIDICAAALEEARARLARRFPDLRVLPIVADFSASFALPREIARGRVVGFFPGSTIGNFTPAEASLLLAAIRRALGPGGRLVIGVDLKKDPARLLAAYNDPRGVTAAFNLNLLARINRELGGGFDLDGFGHQAIYDAAEGRIEMRLVSRRWQQAEAAGRAFGFRRGEAIHTENSYKYAVDEFRATARAAGWSPRRVWTDEAALFSVHELLSA